MALSEKFFKEVKLGSFVELIVARVKELRGTVIALESSSVTIREENGSESVISLDDISYYRFTVSTGRVNSTNPSMSTLSLLGILSVLKDRGEYFFEGLKENQLKVKSYYEAAINDRSVLTARLVSIADSLDYAFTKTHESRPSDYKISENIQKLERLIRTKDSKTAANMLGALYYQVKCESQSLEAFIKGDDNVSAFVVAQQVNKTEEQELFARRHLLNDPEMNPSLLCWLLSKMNTAKDYAILAEIKPELLKPQKLHGCSALIKGLLLKNGITYPSSLDFDVSIKNLKELQDLFQNIVLGAEVHKENTESKGVENTQSDSNNNILYSEPSNAKKEKGQITEHPTYLAARKAWLQEKELYISERLYIEAIRKNERTEDAVADLISMMIQQKNYPKAAKLLGQYGSDYLQSETYSAFYNLLVNKSSKLSMVIFNNAKKAKQRLSKEKQSKSNSSDQYELYYQARNAEVNNKDLRRAIALYTAAIDAGQKLNASIPNLALIYARLEMYTDALELLDEKGKQSMEEDKYLNVRLNIFHAAKDPQYFDEIRKTYDKAILIANTPEKQMELVYNEASLINQLGEYEAAIELYNNCLQRAEELRVQAPQKTKRIILASYVSLCNVYYRAGNMDEARKYARMTLYLQPENTYAKNLLSGQVSEDLIDDDITVYNGNPYILMMIDKLSLEDELKKSTTVRDGVFIGKADDARRIIFAIQNQSAQNDEVRSRNYFTIAKIIRQVLNRDESIEKNENTITEINYQKHLAIGSFYLGNYRLLRNHYYDSARYCFHNTIAVFRDAEKRNPFWAAATFRFIESFFCTTKDISKNSKIYEEKMKRAINNKKELETVLCHAIRGKIVKEPTEFVIGMMEMLQENPRAKGIILPELLSHPQIGLIMNALSSVGDIPSPPIAELNEKKLREYWETVVHTYSKKKNQFIAQIEKVAGSDTSGELEENVTAIQNSEFQRFLNQTDSGHFADFLRILDYMKKYYEGSEFDYKADNLVNAEKGRMELEKSILSDPTEFGYEHLLYSLERLQARIFKESALYGNHRPKISVVQSDECSVEEDSSIVTAPIAFTNQRDLQTADDMSIRIEGEDGITVVNDEKLKRFVLNGNGKPQEKLVKFMVNPDVINSKAFAATVYIDYKFKKNLTETQEEHLELPLSISLERASDFCPIENKFSRYSGGQQVKETSMFFGRDKEISEIVEVIKKCTQEAPGGRCMALYGQTRTGKSSLLYHLEQKLREEDKEGNVIINVGSIGDERLNQNDIADFLFVLLDQLDVELRLHPHLRDTLLNRDINIKIYKNILLKERENAQARFNEVFRELNRCIADGERRYHLIIMIDEFTYIYDWIRLGQMTDQFMKFWKAFLQNNEVFVVLIGQDHMGKFVEAYPNEFGTIDLRKITYLEEEFAKELMSKPILLETDDGEKKTRYQPGALDRIYELTAGSAFLIMKFCDGLVEYLNKMRSARITRAHVDDFLQRTFFSLIEEKLFEPQYDDKSNLGDQGKNEENKRILRKIALQSDKNEWATLRNVVENDRDRAIVDALEKRDVLIVRKGSCKIKVALYKEWILSKN